MTYIQALLMGVIQGLSEFLPVSSSAHIVFTSHLYQFFTGREFAPTSSGEIFFDIIIHLGTLTAVLIYLRKEIFEIIRDFFTALKSRDFSSESAKLPIYIIIGSFITALIAFPLKHIAEQLTAMPDIVGLLLVVTGVILFTTEYIFKKFPYKSDKITLKAAIITGIAQGLAAFPGISRSGSTIAAGMLAGVDRVKCAKYSFLLSIPIIVGTSLLFPLIEMDKTAISGLNIGVLLTGFLSSAIVGFFCIKYFIKFLQKYSMKVFAYYCWVVGILMFVAFSFFIK